MGDFQGLMGEFGFNTEAFGAGGNNFNGVNLPMIPPGAPLQQQQQPVTGEYFFLLFLVLWIVFHVYELCGHFMWTKPKISLKFNLFVIENTMIMFFLFNSHIERNQLLNFLKKNVLGHSC